MASSVIKQDPMFALSNWKTVSQSIYDSTNTSTVIGNLAVFYNPSLKIGIAKWSGNSHTPTKGTYYMSLPSDAVPPDYINFQATLRNGDNMEVRASDARINVTLSALTWSGGSVAYKIK